MKKYKTNLIVSLLSFLSLIIIYYVLWIGHELYGGEAIIPLILVITYYVAKYETKNKYVNKVIHIILIISLLFIVGIALLVFSNFLESIYDSNIGLALGLYFRLIIIYFLYRLFIDSFINYKNKKFDFTIILKIISLVFVTLNLIRIYLVTSSIVDITLFEKESLLLLILLGSAIICDYDFTILFKTTKISILKIALVLFVGLTFWSVVDTLDYYTSSDERRPLVCFYVKNTEKGRKYYSFGYSVEYVYGDKTYSEYKLFDLISLFKR